MSQDKPVVYLIPSVLQDEVHFTIPPYVIDAVKDCKAFFVENERTARRYLKALWKEIVIDDYRWYAIHKAENTVKGDFIRELKSGSNIGIISEAGCPGIADPGQLLVQSAHAAGATVRPLVGPSSILLALMASGMNGQSFYFHGYLPIDQAEKIRVLKAMETESARKNSTQIFIETPYRNNQLFETMLKVLGGTTRLCIAADLTSPQEYVRTTTISEWMKQTIDLHKRPTIFCLYAA